MITKHNNSNLKMKTPILVSKIHANTTGVIKVEFSRKIYGPVLYTLLFPVTDAVRSEFNPNSAYWQYHYQISKRIRKFIDEHEFHVLDKLYSAIDDQHIIPIKKIPTYKTI